MTVLVDFRNSVAPDFAFEAFAGNTTATAEGVQVAVPLGMQTMGTPNNFGGLGQNTSILGTPAHTNTDTLTVRVRRDAGTTATQFVVAVRERGPNTMTQGEFFSFNVAVPDVSTVGSFVDIQVPLDPSGANFNFNGDSENMMLDDDVVEVSVQSRFGENNVLNLTVESITTSAVTPVPEPSGALLVGLGLMAGLGRRVRG